MDETTGLCQGCDRSSAEIAAWAHADESQKALILAAVTQRRQRREVALRATDHRPG